jgi:hypothetical protein
MNRVTAIRLSTKRHRLLEAEAFDSFLRIETRRAVRSRKSLVLLLLDVPPARDLSPVVDLLSSSVRATDYIGWRESGDQPGAERKRLGILFTEVESERGEDIAKLLSAKIARLMRQQLHAAEQPTATLLPSGRSFFFVPTGTT